MNEEHYILFDQYLANELSSEAKVNFEKQLLEDQEFASAFEIFKELNVHLENKFGNENELNAYKENLKSISKDHFKTKKPKVIAFKPWQYAAAASVAILVGLFFFQNINPSFDDYNNPESASFTERGDINQVLKNAEVTFNDRNYKAAISHFEAVLKEKNTPEIQLYYGISLLEDNRVDAAEVVFNQIKKGNSIFKNKATWYLALSKLKQKDYNASKKILETIPEDYENYDQVQQLLNELD